MGRIAVLTSGGDAPGMNAAIGADVRTAIEAGFEVSGLRDSFEGLIAGRFVQLRALVPSDSNAASDRARCDGAEWLAL